MAGRTETGAAPATAPRTLAEVYRRFAEAEAAGTSPLHERVALAVSRSDGALRAIGALPARSRRPAVVLAALHDLALAGRAAALAAAYAARDGEAAGAAAVDTLLRRTDQVAALAGRRRPQGLDPQRCAVLHPAITEAARRAGAGAVGLVALSGTPGLDLHVDRVGITYGDARSLGDPASPVQLSCAPAGDRPVPSGTMPEVVARIGLDADPVDVTDPDDARWLRACVPPDDPERTARLEAGLRVAASAPALLLRGNAVDLLPDAVARVPRDALPVVTTTWALSQLPPAGRPRFLHRLADAAARRPVAWVSVEGVGVAPEVPTLGDRRASGHSIVGLAALHASTVRVGAVGRCWSRGRVLAWLAAS
jgi:hypothetical protein